jgi:hypothetical protein
MRERLSDMLGLRIHFYEEYAFKEISKTRQLKGTVVCK